MHYMCAHLVSRCLRKRHKTVVCVFSILFCLFYYGFCLPLVLLLVPFFLVTYLIHFYFPQTYIVFGIMSSKKRRFFFYLKKRQQQHKIYTRRERDRSFKKEQKKKQNRIYSLTVLNCTHTKCEFTN